MLLLLIVVLPGNHFIAVLLIVLLPEIHLTVIIPGSPFNWNTLKKFFWLLHSLAISLILALPRPGGSFDNDKL